MAVNVLIGGSYIVQKILSVCQEINRLRPIAY